jgi:hypothetical protein
MTLDAIQAPPAAGIQPLNPLDVAMRCVDRSIRGMGYPGFETQMLVWLKNRVHAGKLRDAIEGLSRRRPVITARLVDDAPKEGAAAYWQLQNTTATLEIALLAADDEQSVLDRAEQLISTSCDPTGASPVRFHLLRRKNAGDVFLMQYNHVLMDQSASITLLRELNMLVGSPSELDEAPQHEPRNVLNHWLRRLPRARRREAAAAAVELQGRTLRGRAAILGTGEEDKPRQVHLRIATRVLEPDAVRAIHAHSGRLCGLPSMSMTILACAFRAIQRLAPAERNAERNYIAGIGLDMNLRRQERAVLQNLMSVVPVFARPQELADRDELIRVLSRQIRQRVQAKIDWGVLRLVNGFQRRPRHIRWVVEHTLRWTFSLWYAYFGSLDAVGERLCGCLIDRIQYVGPTWSPLGLSLLANQYRGSLYLQATYDPDLVACALAEEFLERVLSDLIHVAAL